MYTYTIFESMSFFLYKNYTEKKYFFLPIKRERNDENCIERDWLLTASIPENTEMMRKIDRDQEQSLWMLLVFP